MASRLCDYFSHHEITAMNTTEKTFSLANLNLLAAVSTVLASAYFVAVSFLA